MQKVTSRLLIVQGTADKLIAPDIGHCLQQAAWRPSKPELLYIDRADHDISTHESELIHRVLTWLKSVAP